MTEVTKETSYENLCGPPAAPDESTLRAWLPLRHKYGKVLEEGERTATRDGDLTTANCKGDVRAPHTKYFPAVPTGLT